MVISKELLQGKLVRKTTPKDWAQSDLAYKFEIGVLCNLRLKQVQSLVRDYFICTANYCESNRKEFLRCIFEHLPIYFETKPL